MKKGKRLLVTLLSLFAFMGVGLVTLAGCGGKKNDDSGDVKADKFKITWTVQEHATVEMDGGGALPKEAENGTQVSFTVKLDDGYALDSVKSNGKRVSAKSGKYSIAITKDTEIVVAVKESVGSLVVSTKPTKLTYIAGDEIDLAGMVVQVTYGTGRSETLAYGGEGGYSVYPTVFEGGETEFEVSYSGTTVKVALDKRVEFLVKIDPNGGTIDESWMSKIEGMNLNNYKVENGVVSFTYYNNLPRTINLPTKQEISRTNYSLTGWSYEGSISNTTNANVDAVAGWQIELVDVSSVDFVSEGGVPYLVIRGTYKAAEEVYLFLYEGNKDISLKGDTYTGHSGEPFEARLQLSLLSDCGENYAGAWMDIRFNAIYEGQETSMEVYISQVEVDTGKKIVGGDFVYLFANWNGLLKVYFQDFKGISYNLLAHEVGGKDYLQIAGAGYKDYANCYVEISWWQGSSETEGAGAVIDADGNFVVEYPLEILGTQIRTNAFAHISIYADSTKEVLVYGSTNTNVAIADIYTAMPALPETQGDIHHAFRYVGSDKLVYYVGYAWDGLMVYVVDETIVLDDAYVELKDGKVYYVVTGTTILTSDEFLYGFYFQHINNIDGLGEGCVYNDYQDTDPVIDQHAEVADGAFKMSISVSDLIGGQFKEDNATKWGLISKYYFGSNSPIEIKPKTVNEDPIELDGVRYSVFKDNTVTWNIACLVLEKI